MMKKIYLILCGLSFLAANAFAQTTYYWVGGLGPTSYTSTGNWNTQLDGGGVSRSVAGAQPDDVLIFDGSNVGGTVPATGAVTVTASSQACGKLLFQNNAVVHVSRTSTGSAAITINGGSGDDFVLNAGCQLTLGGPNYNYDVSVVLGAAATGLVQGSVYLSPLSESVHTRSYITVPTAGALVFETGAACYITDSTASSGFNASAAGSIVFRNGASMYYYSGRSPMGNNAATQFVQFETGSNCYFRGSNVSYIDGSTSYSSSAWTNAKIFANLYIENGATLKADGVFFKADHVRIDNFSTFTSHTSGNCPVHGNLQVDGVLNAPAGSTNILVMAGSSPQTISGSGNITLPSFTVANSADVTLTKAITVSTNANIVGRLDFGSSGLITGDATFTSRVNGTAASITGNTVAGSYLITNIIGTLSGNAGLGITGSGIDAGTSVGAFATGNMTISLSKPATLTQTGASFDFYSDSAILATANANGFNELNGSVTVNGTRNFQGGTNYEINAATASPFGISSAAGNSMVLGNVTVNAATTTNYNLRLNGTLTLNNGTLTIRPVDTVRILYGNAVAGAPFSQSKYIVCGRTGNDVGVLRIDAMNAASLFPVGTANYYLPVTLTPESAMEYAVSVFEGVTTDGSTGGTSIDAAQKATVVDAVWSINRTGGTGNCQLAFGWDAALEGTSFANYTNGEIGISRHNGTDWDVATGTGDNSLNIASANFSSFSPFIITRQGVVLPLQFTGFNAVQKRGGIELNWTVQHEQAIAGYTVERSYGQGFEAVGYVSAAQRNAYDFLDAEAKNAVLYYRLKITELDGRVSYSTVLMVKMRNQISVSVYPNPVVNHIVLSGLPANARITLRNAAGTAVHAEKTTAGSLTIDMKARPAGVYIVEVLDENNERFIQQIVKQ